MAHLVQRVFCCRQTGVPLLPPASGSSQPIETPLETILAFILMASLVMDMCWGFFPGTKRMPTPLLRAVKLLPGIGATRFQHDSVDSEDIVCWQRGDSTAQEPCQGYPAGLPDRLFKLGRGHAYPIIHCSAEGQFEAGERLRKLFQTMILRSHLLSTSLLAPFRP